MSSAAYPVPSQQQLNEPAGLNNGGPKKIVYFAVGPNKHTVKCPFCNQEGETYTTQKIDSWDSVSTIVSFFCCCCPLSIISCIAYMIPCFKIRQHYCAKCGEYLGTYRRPKL